MKFNERLKNIRKRFKVTQKSIADYLGVTLRTYQRYEEGKIEPPLSTVSAISQYLNMPVDCLLGNGFYSNWEEIIPYKDKILANLAELNPDLTSWFDITSLTESEAAIFFPAIFKEIIFDGSKITLVLFGSSSAPADESQKGLPENPNV